MKKIFLLSAIGGLLGLLNSCSTDFDVVAPYKEMIVINGLLNPLDSVHYIHVGKIFLGEGNVYTMAQQKDSVNYGDILDVKLEGVVGKNVVQSIILQRTTEIDKDSGAFAYPYQVMYKTSDLDTIHTDGREYRITVTNRETGVTATSKTKVFKDIRVTSPNVLSHDTVDWASAPNAPYNVNYVPDASSAVFLHDMIMRIHYREIDPSNISTDKSFDWNFNEQTAGSPVKFSFYKNDFFRVIGQNIPVRPGYTIRLDNLENGRFPFEIIIIEAPEDLVTYYKLINSDAGIVIDKPAFTTVENGLGLFTGRLMHSEFLFPDIDTQAAFDTSRYTRDLNFEF